MIDLITTLGFMIVLAGIADSVLAFSAKDRIANTLLRRSNAGGQKLLINIVADRWMGSKLISVRAFLWSTGFSLISLVVALIAAGFPNVSLIREILNTVFANSTGGLTVLFVCVVGCLVADFVSIAQTRMFARTIERFNNKTISLILCISDITMSITFFVIIFSLFRAIAYIMVCLSLNNGSYQYSSVVAPAILTQAIDNYPKAKNKLTNYKSDQNSKGAAALLKAMYKIGSNNASKGDINISNTLRSYEIPVNSSSRLVRYNIKKSCFPGNQPSATISYDAYMLYYRTSTIFINGLSEAGVKKSDLAGDWEAPVKEAFRDALIKPGNCPTFSYDIKRLYNSRALLSEVSPIDVYLSAFGMTMRDAFAAITTKFSAYYTPDLGQETKEFIYSAWISKSQSLLGMNGEDSEAKLTAVFIGNGESTDAKSAYIPFTTFVVSSLTSSIILVLAVLLSYFVKTLRLVKNIMAQVIDQNAFTKIVLTSTITLMSILITTFYVIWSFISFMWRFVLS
ncbi:hypothetical protein AB5I39_05240 [Sphingomonas sp. MMS24-J45]|uniref:hypothetical protein n=1 Tax=Sphingomonas sp. MMS24-J45 TaxID=3238806 RepID=UPI00384DD9A6